MKYTDLPDGEAIFISPLKIQAIITGACMAKQDKTGAITLTYEDGTTEKAVFNNPPDVGSFDNWFDLVGMVQSQARSRSAKITLGSISDVSEALSKRESW